MRLATVALLGSWLLMLVGCGGGRSAELPPLVPVSGTITLDGKPIAGVSVSFLPFGSTRGGMCYGITDDSGRYELLAGDRQKGSPTGEFRVICSKWIRPDGSAFTSDGTQSPEMAGAKQMFAPRYSDQARTELKATVPANGGTFDFALNATSPKGGSRR